MLSRRGSSAACLGAARRKLKRHRSGNQRCAVGPASSAHSSRSRTWSAPPAREQELNAETPSRLSVVDSASVMPCAGESIFEDGKLTRPTPRDRK